LTLPVGVHACVVALLLLPGALAWAQAASPPAREVKVRRLELSRLPAGEPPEVRVAPELLTVLEFDARLSPESTMVEGRESRFALLEINTHTLVLRPAVRLAPGERLLLTVGFADGLAPARAVFALVAHPTEVDGQLQVVRRPLSSEALQARLEAVLARCEAGGLAKAVLAGAVDKEGVTHGLLKGTHLWNGLVEVPNLAPHVYRSWKLLVAVAPVQLPAGEVVWIPGEARLLDTEGATVRAMPAWMDVARLEPGGTAVIAVELERHPQDAGKTFFLEVREKGGGRGVLLKGVEL
jgi:uncharacterized protein (TIGR02268 family)